MNSVVNVDHKNTGRVFICELGPYEIHVSLRERLSLFKGYPRGPIPHLHSRFMVATEGHWRKVGRQCKKQREVSSECLCNSSLFLVAVPPQTAPVHIFIKKSSIATNSGHPQKSPLLPKL